MMTADNNIILHKLVLILSMVLFAMVLTSCDSDSGESGASESGASATQSMAEDAGMTEEEIAAYQDKVSSRVSSVVGGAMVNALVEDWGISSDQAKCLLRDPGILERVESSTDDPEVQAVFKDCGVDPAVVK